MREDVSPGATLFAVSVASFLVPFMLSGVGIALPSIGREFHATALQLGLVETSYVAANAIFLLAMGRLGDIHGRRRVFQWGNGVFIVTAALLARAPSMEVVIGLRFLQGTGGAMVMATAPAMVVSVFPPEKRGRALGTYVASIYAGLSCGPSLGGLLITALGWRSLFYVCVPLGVATFLVVLWKLRGEWAEARGEPFDWQGSVIYAGAILSLITGAATLATRGWAWGLVGAGVVGLCVFVWVEARTTYPVLNVELLRKNRVFALSNVAALFNYAATFGVTFFMSLYLQYVRGMTPRQAGIFLVVQPLAQALLSPACGRLSDRVPAEWVATAGMALCSLALGVAAAVSAATPMWMIAAILLSLGTGFALFSSPNASVIMGSVAPKYLGVASGLAASMRTLGMMASMAVITVILSICMKGQAVTAATQGAFLLSMRTALVCFSLLCLLGIGCSLGRLRRTRAGVGTEGAVQSVAGK